MKLNKNQSGTTIVELVVVITVLAVVVGSIMSFILLTLTSITINNAKAELLNEAQVGLDIVTNDIRVAANAQSTNRWPDNNAPGAPSNLYSWGSTASTVVLATPVTNSDKDIIYSDSSQYIPEKNDEILFVANNNLYRRIVASTVSGNSLKTTCPESEATAICPKDRLLIENVESIGIKYYNNQDEEVIATEARSIEITINLYVVQYGKEIRETYVNRAVFRNV